MPTTINITLLVSFVVAVIFLPVIILLIYKNKKLNKPKEKS